MCTCMCGGARFLDSAFLPPPPPSATSTAYAADDCCHDSSSQFQSWESELTNDLLLMLKQDATTAAADLFLTQAALSEPW